MILSIVEKHNNGSNITGENEFFCGIERKDFQTTRVKFKHGSRILLGFREIHSWGHRVQAGSINKCSKALVNPPYNFFILSND